MTGNRLNEILAHHTGKPVDDAALEVIMTIDHIDWAAKHAERVLRRRSVRPSLMSANQQASLGYQPYGVVGVIGVGFVHRVEDQHVLGCGAVREVQARAEERGVTLQVHRRPGALEFAHQVGRAPRPVEFRRLIGGPRGRPRRQTESDGDEGSGSQCRRGLQELPPAKIESG